MPSSLYIPRKGSRTRLGTLIVDGLEFDDTNGVAPVNQKAGLTTKAANYTVLTSESGMTFLATAADLVFTLPATVQGLVYRFQLAATGLSAGTGLSVSPAAADKIMGNGFTSADNKDAINSGASDREGDWIEVTGDGVDGWYITGVSGTWAREA